MRAQSNSRINNSGKVILAVITVALITLVAVFAIQTPGFGIPGFGNYPEVERTKVRKNSKLVTLPGVESFPSISPDVASNSSDEIEVPTELLEVAEFIDSEKVPIDELLLSKYLANSTEQEVTNWYIKKIIEAGYTIASPYGKEAILNITSPTGEKYAIDITQINVDTVEVIVVTNTP